jgi:two-component system cell cycle response regulator DivK
MENSDRPTGIVADRPTVMVADDYDDVRSILKSWLEQHDCRVVEAVTGQEAVELAERERPDLILMDLAMPEIDGFGAVFLIRTNENLRDVPIIGISAYGELGLDTQLKIDPKAVGFNDYLEKPFGPAKLYELVDRYLPNNRAVMDTN